MEKQCVICEKSFYVKPSHYKKRKCCCRICKDKLQSLKLSGENNPNFGKGSERICVNCNKKYKSSPSRS
jgi:hypothetical protein